MVEISSSFFRRHTLRVLELAKRHGQVKIKPVRSVYYLVEPAEIADDDKSVARLSRSIVSVAPGRALALAREYGKVYIEPSKRPGNSEVATQGFLVKAVYNTEPLGVIEPINISDLKHRNHWIGAIKDNRCVPLYRWRLPFGVIVPQHVFDSLVKPHLHEVF